MGTPNVEMARLNTWYPPSAPPPKYSLLIYTYTFRVVSPKCKFGNIFGEFLGIIIIQKANGWR
jgi:hypothetical protein